MPMNKPYSRKALTNAPLTSIFGKKLPKKGAAKGKKQSKPRSKGR